jgi:glutamate carboxypeptidase
MKGGIVLALMALEFLAAKTVRVGTVELHSVPDEETRTQAFGTVDRARGADAALVLECARENGDLVVERKAVCWLRMIAAGRAAHAGTHPEEGRSALLALCREILRCDRLNDGADGLTVVAGTMMSGTTPNVVPDRAEARFDLRAPKSVALERAVAGMSRFGSHQDVRIALEDVAITPGMERNAAVDALFAEAQAIGTSLGKSIGGVASGGQSDGNWAASMGIPTVDGLGPIGGLDHTPDEYLDLPSVPERCGLLAGLIDSVGHGLLTPFAASAKGGTSTAAKQSS